MSNKTPKASVKKTALARKIALAAGITGALLILGVSAYVSVSDAPQADLRTKIITFGGKRFQVAVADTPESRAKGLGDYRSLADDEGMLFVFKRADEHCFWMKNVEFPIDIFWFNEDLEIVKSIDSLSPRTYPDRFCPEEPAKYVLEIGARQSRDLQKPLKLEL